MIAQELRIGNLIECNRFVCKIDAIMNQGDIPIEISTDNAEGIISEFNSIPLTEEWLVDFGFTFDGISWCLMAGIEYNNGSFKFSQGRGGTIFLKCEFVHQLQNLYFALTGKELTLK